MKLVAVTRILNEDDIVEAFVRHHAAMIDHHLFLDNGSTDRTLEILRALKADGLNLTVLQSSVPYYTEIAYNTALLKQARAMFGADWVLFLDTDEFVDTRHEANSLNGIFAALPGNIHCFGVPCLNYFDLPTDDYAELTVPLRMRRRERQPPSQTLKMFVSGRLSDAGATIGAGQHDVFLNGQLVAPFTGHKLVLAHYFRRSGWQAISKAVMGRLKVLAAGKSELDVNRSAHYVQVYEAMRDAPETMLAPSFMNADYSWVDLIDDPLPYKGAPLRYTVDGDPKLKAVRVLIAYAEQLALQHGMLIDTNAGVRAQTSQAALTWQRVI